jgi:hypothetical protein
MRLLTRLLCAVLERTSLLRVGLRGKKLLIADDWVL